MMKLKKNTKKLDLNQHELVYQTCDSSHEAKII